MALYQGAARVGGGRADRVLRFVLPPSKGSFLTLGAVCDHTKLLLVREEGAGVLQ